MPYTGGALVRDSEVYGWHRPPHLAAEEMLALSTSNILRYNEQIWLGLHQESFAFAPLTPMATELLPALRDHFAHQVY